LAKLKYKFKWWHLAILIVLIGYGINSGNIHFMGSALSYADSAGAKYGMMAYQVIGCSIEGVTSSSVPYPSGQGGSWEQVTTWKPKWVIGSTPAYHAAFVIKEWNPILTSISPQNSGCGSNYYTVRIKTSQIDNVYSNYPDRTIVPSLGPLPEISLQYGEAVDVWVACFGRTSVFQYLPSSTPIVNVKGIIPVLKWAAFPTTSGVSVTIDGTPYCEKQDGTAYDVQEAVLATPQAKQSILQQITSTLKDWLTGSDSANKAQVTYSPTDKIATQPNTQILVPYVYTEIAAPGYTFTDAAGKFGTAGTKYPAVCDFNSKMVYGFTSYTDVSGTKWAFADTSILFVNGATNSKFACGVTQCSTDETLDESDYTCKSPPNVVVKKSCITASDCAYPTFKNEVGGSYQAQNIQCTNNQCGVDWVKVGCNPSDAPKTISGKQQCCVISSTGMYDWGDCKTGLIPTPEGHCSDISNTFALIPAVCSSGQSCCDEVNGVGTCKTSCTPVYTDFFSGIKNAIASLFNGIGVAMSDLMINIILIAIIVIGILIVYALVSGRKGGGGGGVMGGGRISGGGGSPIIVVK